jgi:RNA polymerase sigma factor (sigma-70 family)
MTHVAFALDLSLAQRSAEHDASARRDLVHRLLPRAQRLCLALLRNPTDAKDACQMAMIQILRSVHSYRGECSIEHWSDRIVSRTALRWRAADRLSTRTPLQDVDATSFAAAPSRILARECLDRLPEVQRTALVLRCCFDYSVDEIAEVTKASRNTVKDRLLRARRTLRALARGDGSSSEANGGDTSTCSAGFSLPTTH